MKSNSHDHGRHATVIGSALDEDESRLESLVFGSTAVGAASTSGGSTISGSGGAAGVASKWADADDDLVRIDIASQSRLRKLRRLETEVSVSATEFSRRQRERARVNAAGAASGAGHGGLADPLDWAELPSSKRMRRNAAVAGSVVSDSEDDEAALLRRTTVVAKGGAGADAPLAPSHLSVTRLRDCNKTDPSKAVIQAAEFHHSNGSVMFTAGLDHTLRFFSVDGKRNAKVAGVYFPDLPIASAGWSCCGDEVWVTGRRPFWYVYDVAGGTAQRIPRVLGRDERSLESCVLQQPKSTGGGASGSSSSSSGAASYPESPLAAFLGNDGTVVLVSQRSKTWASNLKMSGTVRATAFCRPWLSGTDPHRGTPEVAAPVGSGASGVPLPPVGSGGSGGGGSTGWADLLSVGGDGEVYRWDLRTMRCVLRHADEGSTGGTALAATDDGRWYAVGSNMGVVNVYDSGAAAVQSCALGSWARGGSGSAEGAGGAAALRAASAAAAPRPALTNLSLTTAVSQLRFSPGPGEALLVASQRQRDALRVLHTPTGTAFGNWPTAKTPLHYVTAASFSPHGGYLTVGNDRGRALLYRLNHFAEA